MLAGIQSELDRHGLIQRANANALSSSEMEDLRLLLRKQNALYALKAQHVLRNPVQESR
ncbi:hypothetical protein ATI61_111189 [Archangium gephyra]|uniref:Uncharacterized protein n=1 Tax=Archangium gephyra TaxID=48 RepID=A0AAC8TIV8_9BACT|nr:hypothetical protein [Archangium gephyra]AKJ07230.1 Hypothetical protein AA314_08856 [Archangium gephyra]REG26639.1 hypothetical protein ATI61_111189 [Archangium gephyra]